MSSPNQKTGDLLRAAAAQVALEESASSEEILLQASEEIFNAMNLEGLGIQSPREKATMSQKMSSQKHIDKQAPFDTVTVEAQQQSVSTRLQEVAAVDEGINDLLKTMGRTELAFEEAKPARVSILEDSRALAAAIISEEIAAERGDEEPGHVVSSRAIEKDLQKAPAKSGVRRDAVNRYEFFLNKKKASSSDPHRRAGPENSKGTADNDNDCDDDNGRSSRYNSLPGKIARFLGHPWSENSLVRGSVDSYTQEALLRSMRHIVPSQSLRSSGHVDTDLRSLAMSRSLVARPSKNREPPMRSKLELLQSSDRLFRAQGAFSTAPSTPRRAEAKRGRSRSPRARDTAGGDDVDVAKADVMFFERQEAWRRKNLSELEFRMGKAEYDALVDKKQCPKCGAKKSYDEEKEKRKKCPSCGVEYANKLSWGKIGSAFFDRTETKLLKSKEEKQKILNDLIEESRLGERKVFDKRTGKLITVKVNFLPKGPWTKEMEEEFFERIDEYLVKRFDKLRLTANDMYRELSFRPKTRSGVEKDDDQQPSSREIVEAFLQRYYEDLEHRRDVYPQRFREKAEKAVGAPFESFNVW